MVSDPCNYQYPGSTSNPKVSSEHFMYHIIHPTSEEVTVVETAIKEHSQQSFHVRVLSAFALESLGKVIGRDCYAEYLSFVKLPSLV